MALQRNIDNNESPNHEDKSEAAKHKPMMSAALIEKIVKLYKTHRNIVDQEKGWIKKVVDLMYKK